jgi:hypothetical protein
VFQLFGCAVHGGSLFCEIVGFRPEDSRRGGLVVESDG